MFLFFSLLLIDLLKITDYDKYDGGVNFQHVGPVGYTDKLR